MPPSLSHRRYCFPSLAIGEVTRRGGGRLVILRRTPEVEVCSSIQICIDIAMVGLVAKAGEVEEVFQVADDRTEPGAVELARPVEVDAPEEDEDDAEVGGHVGEQLHLKECVYC